MKLEQSAAHRTEVGPVQTIAVGPVETIVLKLASAALVASDARPGRVRRAVDG